LSDVVCQKCSTAVGQYCRETPTPEKYNLRGIYFYKLSKVTLKGPQLEAVDPIFACDEDMRPDGLGSPVPSIVAPDPKWSHPPPSKSHFRKVYQASGMMPPPHRTSRPPARSSQAPEPSSRLHGPNSDIGSRNSSVRGSSIGSQRRTASVRPAEPAGTAEGLLALRRVLEQDVVLTKMTKLMESMQRELREFRESTGPSQPTPAARKTPAEDGELQVLRAENEAMKEVLRTLPAQTHFQNPRYSQGPDDEFGTPESSSSNAFGERRQNADLADDTLFFEDDGMDGGYDDFPEPMTDTSGLANLERDATQGYSVWEGAGEGSDGADFSDNDEDPATAETEPISGNDDHAHSDPAMGERHSARSRERRQTLPADFIAEEQRYLLSDSNDENFDPNDPKVKGRKHKRTRSAERRRRERLERQQESLWKKGVPGGGYENGDGWVEQRRHHSGRFGRKAAVSGGLAVYPKYVNDKLFANGRQIPTTHKRLARELVYLGLDDWIDKDKSDALYRRTIRVARKHYAFHHGGISSKALCQGKYTKKDLEQVGMWDDELFEEINMGEESDVEKLDFPLDPALQKSIQRWKKEGAQAKERRRKAALAAAEASGEGGDQTTNLTSEVPQTTEEPRPLENIHCMTEFSDEDGGVQMNPQSRVPQVADRVERHTKFDAIWQAPQPASGNPVLSIIQHAEARIRAAEEEMGPTFKSKKAQKFRTISQLPNGSTDPHAQISSDIPLNSASSSTKLKDHVKKVEALRPGSVRTVAEHLEVLDLSEREEKSFVRELRAYFSVDRDTGAQLSAHEHISLTDEQLEDYAIHFLETNIVMVGGSRKIGFSYWPDDGSRKLSYVAHRKEITQRVYDILVVMRYNKARYLQRLNKAQGNSWSMPDVVRASKSANGKKSTSTKARRGSKPPLGRPPLFNPFDNGLRYKVTPGFLGNGYYYADGSPRSAEDAARLKRKYERKGKGRASMPVFSLSGLQDLEQEPEQDVAQRRATIGDVDFVREASVFGDSVLQMASAMKQLTQAFGDTSEQREVDASADEDDLDEDDLEENDLDEDDLDEHDSDAVQSMAIDDGALQDSEVASAGDKPTAGVNADNTCAEPGVDVTQPLVETKDAALDSAQTSVSHAAGYEDGRVMVIPDEPTVDTLPTAVDSGFRHKSSKEVPTVPALTTRSSARAAASRRPSKVLGVGAVKPKQPIVEARSHTTLTSPSDKENATPLPELTVSSDAEPPAKKLKTMIKRGRERPPRKSAAELDQLAKETMERETRSTVKRSRSGLQFGS
jgi:hypothetical protein